MSEVLKVKQLADMYAEHKGIGKGKAEEELKDFFEFARKVIVEEQAGFKLGDVGTFKLDVVPEKERTIPSGKTVVTPTHYALKFKVNAATKNALKEYVFED